MDTTKPASYVQTNGDGQPTAFIGRPAVEIMRLASLLSGLRLQQRTGLKLSRHVNPRAIAKAEFGLKTNDFAKLIAAGEAALDKAKAAVPYLDEIGLR